MKPFSLFLIAMLPVLAVNTSAGEPGLKKILAKNAELVQIETGFRFTEGPAAHEDGRVFFTDQPNNKIHIWDPNGGVSEFEVDGERSNGLYFSNDGQLLACADYRNKLIRFDMDGNKTVLVDGYKGKHLNGPNDVWQHPGGHIFFTDPYYKRPWWPEGHEELQEERGVYLLTPEGDLQRVAADFKMPNGIIGTPDGKNLYVADANGKRTYRFDIQEDGTLTNRVLFAEEGSDGMTIDNQGNVYFTTRSVVLIIDKDGNKVGEIEVPEKPSNVTFAGKNRDILFITAQTSIYRIDTKVKGVN